LKLLEKDVVVVQDDLDEMQHVNNVRYLQWVQDIAKAHWIALTTPFLQETYAWVVLSHQIEYKAAAVLDDILTLKTFVISSKGVSSVRVVEITHKNSGKLIAKATTKWCLLNSKTKKPVRIPSEIFSFFHN